MRIKRSQSERLWEKVQQEGSDNLQSCWLWMGTLNHSGYGRITGDNGEDRKAHRLAWEEFFGTIPDGLTLDHLCRVKNCVNPYHLEPVTIAVNVQRSAMNGARLKAHCKRGHDLSVHSAPDGRGQRYCKPCASIRGAKRDARKRLERSAA